MNRSIGKSESIGDTSPRSDLNGAPKRRRAVGELNSEISYLTSCDMRSRLRSTLLFVRICLTKILHELKVSYSVLACQSIYCYLRHQEVLSFS